MICNHLIIVFSDVFLVTFVNISPGLMEHARDKEVVPGEAFSLFLNAQFCLR